jgi:hypothetical protein
MSRPCLIVRRGPNFCGPNFSWAFFQHLHALGVVAADAWLDEHFDQIGVRSTLDPDPIYHAEAS